MHGQSMSMHCVPFDPKCLRNLMRFCYIQKAKDYDIQIVLSSTWRLHEVDYEIVNARLYEYGLRLTDKTDYIEGHRSKEILKYLRGKIYYNYIVIDDDTKDIYDLIPMEHIVTTDMNVGFNRKALHRALKIMKVRSKSNES